MTAALLLTVLLLGSDSTSKNGINDATDNHDLPMLSVLSRTGKKDCCLLSGSSHTVLFFALIFARESNSVSTGCLLGIAKDDMVAGGNEVSKDTLYHDRSTRSKR